MRLLRRLRRRRLPPPPEQANPALPDPPVSSAPPTGGSPSARPDPPSTGHPTASDAATDPLPDPPFPDLPAELAHLVVSDDPVAIEGGRDLVTADLLPALADAYWRLSWAHKLNVIELTQDHSSPDLVRIGSDYLRAPMARGDEPVELGKAIALGHFGQEFDHRVEDGFDRYVDYYNDRELLRAKVAEALELLGVTAESAPDPPARSRAVEAPVVLEGRPTDRLLLAIETSNEAEFDRALADGANVNAVIEEGDYRTCSMLIRAAMLRQWRFVSQLVAAGADLNHRRTGPRPSARDRGQTAVWWAADCGRLDMVTMLVDAGAHPDIPDSHGSTPLHQAAGGGHLDVVEYLVGLGADTMAPIYDGRTPFNMAATHGRSEVVAWFLQRGHPPDQVGGGDYTALMLACEQGKVDMARSLVDAGADVNRAHPGRGIYAGLRGWTPLVFCVRGGRVKITEFMIEAGADPDAVITPATGESPAVRVIDLCHGRQAARLREILVAAGARPEARG